MILTVTNQDKVQFMIYSLNMNLQILVEFMEQRIKGIQKKIYLILDTLRAHHSKVIEKWLAKEEMKDKIAVFHLPAYSQEKKSG